MLITFLIIIAFGFLGRFIYLVIEDQLTHRRVKREEKLKDETNS